MKRVDNGNSSKKTEEETEAKSSPTTVGGALSPQGGGTSGKTKGKKKKEKAEGRVLYEKDKVHHCIHVFTYLERLIDYPLPNLKVAVWAGLKREVGSLK